MLIRISVRESPHIGSGITRLVGRWRVGANKITSVIYGSAQSHLGLILVDSTVEHCPSLTFGAMTLGDCGVEGSESPVLDDFCSKKPCYIFVVVEVHNSNQLNHLTLPLNDLSDGLPLELLMSYLSSYLMNYRRSYHISYLISFQNI